MSLSATSAVSGDAPPKAKIFISYSRKDTPFAEKLGAALQACGFDVLIDREQIYAFEDWRKRIETIITQADTVIFVLSPDAVASEYCHKEVNFAASLNKRFAPILYRAVEGNKTPAALEKLQYVFFNDEAHFTVSVAKLAEALSTDVEWIRRHTEFSTLAQRWQNTRQFGSRGLLLRSPLLEEAEHWIATRPQNAPSPTEATQAFLAESRRAATQRRNLVTCSLGAGLIIAVVLAGFAYWQRGVAMLNEERAIAAAERARSAERLARTDQSRAQKAEFNAIINECTASELLLRTVPHDPENLYNFLSCGVRLGFALIREDRLADSKSMFNQIRTAALSKDSDQTYPVRSFYILLASQGTAVADCAATQAKSKARSDAIGQLVIAANELLRFQPPAGLEQRWQKGLAQRWREEVFRGFLYISNFSNENGDHESSFQYASMLVERLSQEPRKVGDAVRDLARALDHLTWTALITKRWGDALGAAERAKQVVEEFDIKDLHSIRLNHAHALLFNGRIEEARKEYRELNPDDVAKDLGSLIAFGLCHRLFNELLAAPDRCTGPAP